MSIVRYCPNCQERLIPSGRALDLFRCKNYEIDPYCIGSTHISWIEKLSLQPAKTNKLKR